MRVLLQDRPGDWPVRYQVHSPSLWTDPVTGKDESYLAGFSSESARAEYMKLQNMTTE